MEKTRKTDAEWKKILSPLQFEILRKAGTERAFTGPLLENKRKGIYACIACGNQLYSSKTKFDSGTGWPSFFAPISEESLYVKITPYGLDGSEVLCARCEGHHGHVFTDGPRPTGLRYCMNSETLKFIPE